MKYEAKCFYNQGSDLKTNKIRYSPKNTKLFFLNLPLIFKAWTNYLKTYADQTGGMFDDGEELPWSKFDEPTWVSSLAIAIAKEFKNAVIIEELPVIKGSNGSKKGNADIWCCLDTTKKNTDKFNFYMEAKYTPGRKRKLKKELLKPILLAGAGEKILIGKNALLSRAFRDYQNSSDENTYISVRSPHSNEEDRKHRHVFLSLIIMPIQWENEKWSEIVNFSDVFNNRDAKIHLSKTIPKNPIKRNLYNIPIGGMIMREKDNNTGFIALVMMLGESGENWKKT